ncbi:unnamed protein product, partial [Mycena citricolor]
LLSVLIIGFWQGLYALDASDGSAEGSGTIANVLVQALLQSPDFGKFSNSTMGLVLYYLWGVITGLILLNILISLFSSAYSDVVDDAEAQYLAFFASKTVGMIRAPDEFVFPSPFNIIEVLFLIPFELCGLSRKSYAKLNRFVMITVFFVPLAMIALHESLTEESRHTWMKRWLSGDNEGEDERPEHHDPVVDDDPVGRVISKVPFEDLVKAFPDTNQSSEALMMTEITQLRKQLAALSERLNSIGN